MRLINISSIVVKFDMPLFATRIVYQLSRINWECATIKRMEEPSKLFQKVENFQDAILPGIKDQREGKIIQKTGKDTFAILLNIIVEKLRLNIFLFKKFKILLLTLVVLTTTSTLYLLFSEGITEQNILYALIPIILLVAFYTILRYWAQYRSAVEVVNPTYANMFNALNEQKQNSVNSIFAKIFGLKLQNILTRVTWLVFIALVLYFAYYFFKDLGNNF